MFNILDTKPAFHVSIIIINKPTIDEIEMSITETQYKKILHNVYDRFDIEPHLFSLAPDLGILARLEAETITGFKSSKPIISNGGMLAYDVYNLLEKGKAIDTSGENAKYLIQAFPEKLLLKNMQSYRISDNDLTKINNDVRISITSLR